MPARDPAADVHRLLFEANPLPIWVCARATFAFLAANDAAVRIYGYSLPEFLGMTVQDIQVGEARETLVGLRQVLLEPLGSSMHNLGFQKHKTKDGRLIDVESWWGPATWNGQDALVALLADVTERKLAEDSLWASQAVVGGLIGAALDAVIGIDSQGRISSWSPQAESLFGWSRGEAIGQRLADLVIPARYREAHVRGLARFLATGEGPILNQRIELSALHRDGREFPV
ncbi:MAG TPA: PAS domain S-box protein, partial [Vicinamibacteria bacterium]|nr:PAS domain S-box protein [Vicinamibacteria bacterium]